MKQVSLVAIVLVLGSVAACRPARDSATANETLSSEAGAIRSAPASSDPALPVPPGSGRVIPEGPAGSTEPGNGVGGNVGTSDEPVHEGNESAVIPPALQGRWGMNVADCDPKRSDNKGLIRIDAESLRFYESRALLASPRVVEAHRLVGHFRFSGEGMTWERDVTLSVEGDTLTRSDEDGTFTYTRC